MPDDAKVVTLHRPRRPDLAWSRFVLARHEMNLAFEAWLSTSPPAEEVQEEIDGTIAVLNQLLAISDDD